MKKGLENVSKLSKLERLTFRGVKMNDLDLISDFQNLRQLRLQFGSDKRLDAIANVKSLKTLQISRTRQIPNYDFFNSMNDLNSLYFEGMSQMEKLPDLSGLRNLKRIQIENNSKLIDIKNLQQLPSMEIFLLILPENFKVVHRKELLKQAFEVLLCSNTIKYTNIFFWADDEMKRKLQERSIVEWTHQLNI